MAHANKVMRSINAPGETLCVDLFRRPEGDFGFEEYRRDPEGPQGWRPVGHHGGARFATEAAALAAARAAVAWLDEAI